MGRTTLLHRPARWGCELPTFGAAALLLIPGPAHGAGPEQPAAAGTGPAVLEFQLASTRIQTSRIELVDGVQIPVRSKDWTTIVITPITFNGVVKPVEGRCTGSLVGPGTILLAAHCLDQGAADRSLRPSFLTVDSERVPMSCAVFPPYLGDTYSATGPRRGEDLALCHADLKQPHSVLSGMQFEVLDLAPVAAAQLVLMTGYGCTDIAKPTVMDSTLRIGNATIGYPAGGIGRFGNQATVTSFSKDEPSLCPGDSGGPLFTGATVSDQQGQRRIRGVNSSYANALPARFSKIAMLSAPGFGPWVTAWIGKFPGAYVCGVSDSAVALACHA